MRASIIYTLAALTLPIFVTAASHPNTDLSIRNDTNGTQPTTDDSQYKYTFQEFRPRPNPNQSFKQPYFHFKILFRKKSGITEEFFHRHWKTVHADMTLSDADFTPRVRRYNQFHQDDDARNKLQRLITGTGGAMALAPYDAVAEFHTKDYETWEKFILSVISDPVIVADQNKFVDRTVPLHIMGGYDNLIFGSGIRTSSGYDGILPGDRRFRYAV